MAEDVQKTAKKSPARKVTHKPAAGKPASRAPTAPGSAGPAGAPPAQKPGTKGVRRRVYEVAREFDVSSDALMGLLRELGVEAKSHMSSVDPETIAAIQMRFEKEKAAAQEEMARKKRSPTPEPQRAQRPGERKGRVRRRQVDTKAVQENVRRTLAELGGPKGKRRRRKAHEETEIVADTHTAVAVRVAEYISVGELANGLGVKPNDVIAKCMGLGLMATVNQRLTRDEIEMVATELGVEVEFLSEYGEDVVGEQVATKEEDLRPRHPVVTVMGHVDHGKTLLLDRIRQSNVVAGEAGGITQHIGAYEVETPNGKITFLDTPGHEAFTAMRARGARVTDLVVLVAAADNRVMPQTIEAINHAKAAKVPVIVAINKMDLPTANADLLRQELAEHGVMSEDWGGKSITVEISAKMNRGIDKLLEAILLESELLELRARAMGPAKGVIVESRLERGRGPIATVLVQEGRLEVGNPCVAGSVSGKVRALVNERGQRVEYAGPSAPVEVLGLDGVPQAGESFVVLSDEREAREIASQRERLRREQEMRRAPRVTLEEIYAKIQAGEARELNLILKTDVDGSLEVLSDSVEKLSTSEVKVRLIHRAVGNVNESDVLLAAASDAVILAFHVRPDQKARDLARQEHVEIRTYNIIYEAVDEVRAALEGLLEPERRETVLGHAKVLQSFPLSRTRVIAGSAVQSGVAKKGASVRVVRNSKVIFDGTITTLRHFKEDVPEVKAGLECGIGVDGFLDPEPGDTLEIYQVQYVERKL